VVLVNQGTVATRADDLIVPTLRALAGQDLLVIATTGGVPIDRLGIDVPPNARVESFVPFAALMPHLSLVITNGGYGGVQFALAHGVPLIVAGATEEKPEIAARVAWSGAGINLKSKTPAPEQIRAAVDAVLGNPAFRQAARRIQADYAAHDAAHEAATLLEQLARTRQLVARGQPAARAAHEPAMATSG
jgi:UDP:flavonoid glycosyltransferase YjiC (YdhE family)